MNMYIYVYICIYMYVYTYINIYVYIRVDQWTSAGSGERRWNSTDRRQWCCVICNLKPILFKLLLNDALELLNDGWFLHSMVRNDSIMIGTTASWCFYHSANATTGTRAQKWKQSSSTSAFHWNTQGSNAPTQKLCVASCCVISPRRRCSCE